MNMSFEFLLLFSIFNAIFIIVCSYIIYYMFFGDNNAD